MNVNRTVSAVVAWLVSFVLLHSVPALAWHGSGSITALAIDRLTPATLYAVTSDRGVFRSVDGGETWTATDLPSTWVTALAVDPLRPTILYAATPDSGVFKSTNGGVTWTPAGVYASSPAGVYQSSLAIDPATPTTIYAGTDYYGVMKSTDDGTTWDGAGLVSPSVAVLAIDPITPTTLYAGTGSICCENSGVAGGGVFKSTDGGLTWDATGLTDGGDPLWVPAVFALAIDPVTPTTIYAISGSYFYWPAGSLLKSTDGGASWSGIGPVYVSALAIDPVEPQRLYSGTPAGVFKSTDGGVTWNATGLIASPPARLDVQTLAIDPTTPSTLYAGTADGLFKSTDRGTTWKATGLGPH